MTVVYGFSVSRTVPGIIRKNLSTLDRLNFRFKLDLAKLSGRKRNKLISEIGENLKVIRDIMMGRDKYIQKIMIIMDERFEKKWKIPYSLGQLIHSYMWDRDDLLSISPKVLYIY